MVLNLVVNALDSMEEGGTLTIGMAVAAGTAELTFTDTGCGMTADVLENIFEPFFTRSRTGKGTGLGLFISHQIIDQHGGTIQAASRGPGQGSTFTVRIPLELPRTRRGRRTRPEPGRSSWRSRAARAAGVSDAFVPDCQRPAGAPPRSPRPPGELG